MKWSVGPSHPQTFGEVRDIKNFVGLHARLNVKRHGWRSATQLKRWPRR